MKKLFFVSIVSAGLMMGATAAQASCKTEATTALNEIGIEGELVATDKVKVNGKSSLIASYIHWYRTPSCKKGYVVVRTTRTCQVISIYTQTGCEIEDLDNAW